MHSSLSYLLCAALLASSIALTPEECKPLLKPLSLADPSVMFGKFYFLAGYTDHQVYKAMLNVTDSSWVNITKSPSSSKDLLMLQENRMNGTCIKSRTNVTIEGDTAGTKHANMSSVFQMLPSNVGSLVFNINSTIKNAKMLFNALQMSSLSDTDEISGRALYLLAPDSTLKDSDLDQFKKQATCLGYSGEPDFIYNPEKSFCKDGEGITIPITHTA